MPQVSIPNVGVVNFPDSMTPDQISSAIQNQIIPNAPHPVGVEAPSTGVADIIQQSLAKTLSPFYMEGLAAPPTPQNPSPTIGALATGLESASNIFNEAKISDMMPIQEAAQKKYGPAFEGAPPEERARLLRDQAKLNEHLGQIQQTQANIEAIQKKYGQDPLATKINAIQSTPDFKNASTWEQTKLIGEQYIKHLDEFPQYALNVGLSSLPQSIGFAIAAKLGGAAGARGAIASGGYASYSMEYGNEYADLRAQGFSHEEANNKAMVKSGIIALFDAASLNSAGHLAEKMFDGSVKHAIKETAKDVIKEVPKQAFYGAAGEGLGSFASNQPVDPRAIAEEAIGEIAGTPLEAAATYREKREQQAKITPPPTATPEAPTAPTPAPIKNAPLSETEFDAEDLMPFKAEAPKVEAPQMPKAPKAAPQGTVIEYTSPVDGEKDKIVLHPDSVITKPNGQIMLAGEFYDHPAENVLRDTKDPKKKQLIENLIKQVAPQAPVSVAPPVEALPTEEVAQPTPHTLEEIADKGEPVQTKQEAEKAHSDGDTVYGFHEQDEENPVLIKNIDDLKGFTPDQLLVVPKEEPKKPSIVNQLAREEQKRAGWNENWPFIPADLGNADFRQLIADDTSISEEEKKQIFDAGKKLGVISKNEEVHKPETTVEEPKEELPKHSQAKDVPVIPEGQKVDSTDPDVLSKFHEIMETYEPESGRSQEDSFLQAINEDVKSKEEKIQAPPFKKGFASSLELSTAPFNGGWVGGLLIMSNNGGRGYAPSIFSTIYPTKQDALNHQIDVAREVANTYDDKKALAWLDSIDPRLTKEGKIKTNKERQQAKKEAHIEGKKSEPVKAPTIQKSIQKAESTVDVKKIKEAITKQFNKAIAESPFKTAKDWDPAHPDAFIKINVPGDGTFKVKNNVERLEDMKKKLVSATSLRGPTRLANPPVYSGSAEAAIKHLIDENDMQAALEYAKNKDVNLSDIKFNADQTAKLNLFNKNPETFDEEVQKLKSEQEKQEAIATHRESVQATETVRKNQEREKEERFKAIFDTVIRMSQPQLAKYLKEGYVTTEDAKRIAEALPNMPEGVVPLYVVNMINKKLGIEPKTKTQLSKERVEARKAAKPKKAVVSDEEKIVDAIKDTAYKKNSWTSVGPVKVSDFIAKHGNAMFKKAVEMGLLDNSDPSERLFTSNKFAYEVSPKYYDSKGKKITEAPKEKTPPAEVGKDEKKIKTEMVRFASGMSGLSDLSNGSFARAGHHNYGVGVDIGLLSKNAIDQIANAVINWKVPVFVDSGAFSNFKQIIQGKEVKPLDFDKILEKYDAITQAISDANEAEEQDYPRPIFVMPDVVGDQKASLDLIKKHRNWIQVEINGQLSQPLIPLQKGALTLSQAYDQIVDDLGTNNFIVGIPSNEEAVSKDDLAKFLLESKPQEIHFLGAAADSKLAPIIKIVAENSPDTKVTADASKIRSSILNGIAKGKTRQQAINDALFEAEDPGVILQRFGPQGLVDESNIIEGEVRDITNQKLLSYEVSKLSEEELGTLESHYDAGRNTSEFVRRLSEDIIKMTNHGIDVIDKAIRNILQKIQAGVLAVAIILNPSYMSPSAVVLMPTKTVERTVQVRATVPAEVKGMSEGAKRAYEELQPTMTGDKYFTIIDKPTATAYVFNPDGSLVTQSKILLGKATGDFYVGGTDFVQNRITPAGLFNLTAEKGNMKDYDGRTIYTVGNVEEGWSAAIFHTVYTKESDGKARLNALTKEGPADSRYSHGCINGKPELMQSIDNVKMDQSKMFVVPDNPALVDAFIHNTVPNKDLTRVTVKPKTKTVTETVPNATQVARADLVGKEEEFFPQRTQAEINKERQRLKKETSEKTFFNNFTNNLDDENIEKMRQDIKNETAERSATVKRSLTKLLRTLAKGEANINTQRAAAEMLAERTETSKIKQQLKARIDSPEAFLARADKELLMAQRYPDKKYQMSEEVLEVLKTIYAKYPKILDGLKLSIKERKSGAASGNFAPFSRIVTLYKNTSGVTNPTTLRHELMHSLEQMMPDDVYQTVVDNWAKSLIKAIEKFKDDKHKKYFDAVIDFVNHPTNDNYQTAIDLLPDYSVYQYLNPSEFWAVNAEKLFNQKLGGRWENFKRAIQKLFEALKSVFGFDNRYGVHKAFDKIFKGEMDRGASKRMLVDYLERGKGNEYQFANIDQKAVNELDNEFKQFEIPPTRYHDDSSLRDRLAASWTETKQVFDDFIDNPTEEAVRMLSGSYDKLIHFRNKNVFFGTGLESAEFKRYKGQLVNDQNEAIAVVALTNALHASHVMGNVMMNGKLEYNPKTQMFQSVADDHSMKNVFQLESKLYKMLGKETGSTLINTYFNAKRTRSIQNEMLNRDAELQDAVDSGEDIETAQRNYDGILKAYEKIPSYFLQKDDDGNVIKQEITDHRGHVYELAVVDDDAVDQFISKDKEFPELKEMMKNWTAVNHNMLDNMAFGGVMSQRRAEHLKEIKDYVPWFRLQDDAEELHAPSGNIRGLTNVGKERKFKKGEVDKDIDNVVDNMTYNVMMMGRNAMKNFAALRIAKEYATRKQNGKLAVFPKEGVTQDGAIRTNILVNGKRLIIEFKDPLIAESVIGMETLDIPMIDTLAKLAQLLRYGITFNPVFQAYQVWKDAPTAAAITGVKHPLIFVGKVMGSFFKALNPRDPVVQILHSYGIGAWQTSARTAERELRRSKEIGRYNYQSIIPLIHKAIDHVADASELAQKRAIYAEVLKRTGNEMTAVFQANAIMDHMRRGSGRTAQALTRTTAFLGTAANQIDLLGRSLVGGQLTGKSRAQNVARFYQATAAFTAATLLYCMLNGGDDDYEKLDDQTKIRNFVIGDMKIPSYTSYAFIYKAIPELVYNYITRLGTASEMDATRLRKALTTAATDALLGPSQLIPGGVKTPVEIALNHDFFTGRTVTPKGLEGLSPFLQYNSSTSNLGKLISSLTFGGLNPIEADHLVRGLFGTVGMITMEFSDVFTSDHPERTASQNPLFGQLMMSPVPRGREERFYDLKTRSDEFYKDFMLLKARHDPQADKILQEHEGLVKAHGYVTALESTLKTIDANIRRIDVSNDTPAEKLRQRTEMQQKKNEALKDINQMRLRAGL